MRTQLHLVSYIGEELPIMEILSEITVRISDMTELR